jgi:hypothetical protein
MVQLREALNGVEPRLEWQKNGSFGFLRNAEVGEPLIRDFATPEPVRAEQAARSFISSHRGLFGLRESDLKSLVVERNELIGATDYARGVYYVSFVQKVNGIRVDMARLTFAIHAETGDLYAVTSNVFGMPTETRFRMTERDGIRAALKAAGVEVSLKDIARSVKKKGDWTVARVNSSKLDAPVSIKKVFLPAAPGRYVPGYVAEVWTRDHGLLRVGVDAQRGTHLLTVPRTSHNTVQASGWPNYVLSEDGTINSPELVTHTPDSSASPSGWLSPKGSDGLYRTVGPNVITFYDWAGTYTGYDYLEEMRPLTAAATSVTGDGTSSQNVVFDYNAQWGGATIKDYVQLSMVENWRVLNALHDHYYNLGFTPEEGNFSGDDPVLVNAQDSYDAGTRNNANFSTPEDGTSGRMNMYIFNDTEDAEKDGTMDRQVFSHELGHGLSNRLVNFGDSALYGNQSGAFGEGQSDTFAFMQEPALSSNPDTFALASYLAWEYFLYVQRGPFTVLVTEAFADDILKPMGRFSAYTYNIGDEYDINDEACQRTFAHYGLIPYVHIGQGAIGNRYWGFRGDLSYMVYPEVHSDGEIWGVANWRVATRVREYGWKNSSSDDRMKGLEQTFLMGMQLMPANPNFIQSRDAQIIYEEMTQAEPATCMMKYEFARTGMGKNATAGSDGSYGTADQYSETAGGWPEMTTDFNPWGCAPNTYNASTGDPTVIFSAPAPEVETNKAAELSLYATTPGYNTKATVSGPFIGTLSYTSSTDYLVQSIPFTPTSAGSASFSATVTSSKGDSKTATTVVNVVTPEVLDAAGATDSDTLDAGESYHYKVFIDGSAYRSGQKVSMVLNSTSDVDIDLYFDIDTLAIMGASMGYDADEDGNERIELQRLDNGWQIVNGNGMIFEIEPAAEDFYVYLNAFGFTASDYTMTITRQ